MLQFLQANWGTIVAMLVVALIVFLAVRKMVKDKKAGIGPCGQKCSHCPNAAKCHHADGELTPEAGNRLR